MAIDVRRHVLAPRGVLVLAPRTRECRKRYKLGGDAEWQRRPGECGADVVEPGLRTKTLDERRQHHRIDLGYPSTVQLPDGTLVTAVYFAEGDRVRCLALRCGEDLLE